MVFIGIMSYTIYNVYNIVTFQPYEPWGAASGAVEWPEPLEVECRHPVTNKIIALKDLNDSVSENDITVKEPLSDSDRKVRDFLFWLGILGTLAILRSHGVDPYALHVVYVAGKAFVTCNAWGTMGLPIPENTTITEPPIIKVVRFAASTIGGPGLPGV